MAHSPEALSQQLLDAAKAAGAESCDAIVVLGTSLSIEVREGALEQAERAEGLDLGLRVLVGQRQANVSISDARPDAICEMADRAVAMAKEAPEDPYIGLASTDQLAANRDAAGLELADPAVEPDPATLKADALACEEAAKSVEGVSQVQSATSGYSANDIWLAASNGFSGGYRRTSRGTYCTAIAGQGDGMERDYDGDSRVFAADLRDPNEIGTSAGQRAVDRLNARQPQTGAFPVMFDERISSSLLGHLLAAANGGTIARGSGWLRDKLGAQILPRNLSIIEDPHRPRVTGSRLFDAEGLPTQRRSIVENGVLTGWTLDLGTARKLGLESTANAARGASGPPSPSNWNVSLTQGERSRDDLLKDMGTGLLVTSLMGSTINPNTGDYSRGASGFWVEKGEISHAINECTIAGNLHDMMRGLTPANDARLHLSRPVPSLLVEGLTLAGS